MADRGGAESTVGERSVYSYLEGSVEPSPWQLDRKGHEADNEFLELLLELLRLQASLQPDQTLHQDLEHYLLPRHIHYCSSLLTALHTAVEDSAYVRAY